MYVRPWRLAYHQSDRYGQKRGIWLMKEMMIWNGWNYGLLFVLFCIAWGTGVYCHDFGPWRVTGNAYTLE
jgi:hypothetical protein